MKAITLTQPWASLVAIGAKRIETRGWRTPYRGPLAIHAAKGFPADARDFTYSKVVRELLLPQYQGDAQLDKRLPLGCIVATCKLVSCVPTRELQEIGVVGVDLSAQCANFILDGQERAFGNYALGRWAWLLADIKRYDVPIPAVGHLSLWDWEPPR